VYSKWINVLEPTNQNWRFLSNEMWIQGLEEIFLACKNERFAWVFCPFFSLLFTLTYAHEMPTKIGHIYKPAQTCYHNYNQNIIPCAGLLRNFIHTNWLNWQTFINFWVFILKRTKKRLTFNQKGHWRYINIKIISF
jgi:hypothetical protein